MTAPDANCRTAFQGRRAAFLQAAPSQAASGTLCVKRCFASERNSIMLKWALIFAIIAIVAGILGFGGIAGAAAGLAKFFFVLAIIIFMGSEEHTSELQSLLRISSAVFCLK